MKNLLKASFAATMLSLAFVSARAAETESGYVDFGPFTPSAHGEFVEVNLHGGILKFAAKIAATQEPEAADLLKNLKRIRVNVVSLDDKNRDDMLSRLAGVREKLEGQGWTKLVTVREKDDGDNVDVHVKMHDDDSIDGLVVTVLDRKGEAVFVNIVGNINPEKVAALAEKLDIEPLKHVRVKAQHRSGDEADRRA